MNKAAIVSDAPRAVDNRIPTSTIAEGRRLLEELRAAYQMLGREERQQVKSLMVTLSKSRGDTLNGAGVNERA
jgi:hypothetical protein